MNTKTYKQAFVVLAVSIFIVPQIAFAAWWNPLSWSVWNIFRSAPKTQQVQVEKTTQATSTAKTATTSELSETQKLKKEVSDLKKQLNTAGQPTKSAGSFVPLAPTTITQPTVIIPPPTPKPTEENFKEVVVTGYMKSSATLKKYADETKSKYLPEINRRRTLLVNRISLIKKDPFTNSGDGVVLNQMFDLFAGEHEREVKYIDQILGTIQANLNSMAARQAWYDSNINSLLADDNKFVNREELINTLKQEQNAINLNYEGIENINKAFGYYLDSVIMEENEYAKAYEIIMGRLAKYSEPTTVSAPVYQPSPPVSLPQIPRTTYCTIMPGPSGGLAYATVGCN